MRKKELLYKIITIYLAIILLYTGFVGTLSLYKEIQIHSLKDNHTNNVYMGQLKNNIDFKLDLALKFMYKSSTLHSVENYKHNEGDDFLHITNVFNELKDHLSGFTQSGFSMGLINSNSNIVISPEGTYDYDKFLNKIDVTKETSDELTDVLSNLKDNEHYIIPKKFLKDNTNLITMVNKVNSHLSDSSLYYFILLDSNYIIPTEIINDNNNAYALSLYNDDLVHSFKNSYKVSQEGIFDYLDYADIDDNIKGLKLGQFANYVYPSDVVPGLKYVYTVESVSIISTFLNVLKSILLPSLIILILGLLIVYKASKTSYTPINQILSLVSGSNSSFEKSSELNEIEYIKQSIEKIHTDNDNLKLELNSSLQSLQEGFLRKLLFSLEDEDLINKNTDKLSLGSFKNDTKVVLMELKSPHIITKMIPIKELTNAIKNILQNFASENLKSKDLDFFILPLNYRQYCIITNNLNKKQLGLLFAEINENIKNKLSLDTSAYISSSYNLSKLSSAFQEVLTLSKNKSITSKAINNSNRTSYFYPLEVETCLINYITSNEHSRAKELIVDILEKNLVDYSINPDTLTHLKYSLLDTFKRCINIEDNDLDNFNKKHNQLTNEFLQAPISELEGLSLALLEKTLDYCNRNNFDLENPTASNIFIYIQENFDKDISLTDIAEHFDLSTSYVSKLFKNATGTNFKEYINKLKTNKAKELLATGKYKVNEVSELVGCNNVNSFIRIFKQYEFITPGEYAKSLEI